MNVNDLNPLLRLRLLVGFLGEKAQYDWWPSAFFASSSRLFLEPVFPKTTRLAQYHAVVEAARRLHDERLSVGSYHLFRLPEEAESDLHGLVLTKECDVFMGQHLKTAESAMAALEDMARRDALQEIKAPAEGNRLLGTWDDQNLHRNLFTMAGLYVKAFQGGTKCFPYFAS